MEEPSILDYLKSKLNPRSHAKLELPPTPPDAAGGDGFLTSLRPQQGLSRRPLPWRSLFALALALTGQLLLEPPEPQPSLALAFYFFGLLFLAWAVWASEWKLPALRPQILAIDPGTFRLVPFFLACGLGLAAFFLFNHGLFSLLNVSLWFLTIALFVYSLWLPKIGWRERWQQTSDFFTSGSWYKKITPWLLLLVFVWGAAIFFRFYQLNSIPAEPFSDHAEKLLDVYDITRGQIQIFFPRNTGREFFQMYLTLAVSTLFGTGLSFLSLKLGTALAGFFTLPYIYLLGKEFFNKRVAILALALTAVAYWPNVISRVGLRFPLYPLFTAPVLFYLVRGLRTQNRNDFILCGLFLGLGLNGYSSFRFVPIFVLIAVGIYLLHIRGSQVRRQTILATVILALAAFLLFLPLLRYTLDSPDIVLYRSLTRITSAEQPLPGDPLMIFFANLKNALLMFNWNNGEIWVHSIPNRPALDLVSAVFFIFGLVFLIARYYRQRDWRDLLLVLSVPLLLMPSVMSLAFPNENPSLNRTGGAYIPVFIIAAFAMDALYSGLKRLGWRTAALTLIASLVVLSATLNYDLVFNQYATQFRLGIWNVSEIADLTRSFEESGNSRKNAWVIPYPYWIDTRLVGAWLADPAYDPVIWPDQIGDTVSLPGAKLFFVKDNDSDAITLLRKTYPQGDLNYHYAAPGLIGKDFWVFSVPDSSNLLDAEPFQP
jgi:hypothetical protein